MNKKHIKENAFDMGIAGTMGSMDYSTGFGTPASPNVSQNTAQFNNDKALGNHSNTANGAPSNPDDNDKKIDAIYKKPVTPSPDEVMAGLKYELQNMVKKDKAKAKEIVLNNLMKNSKHYTSLGMLGIKEPMNEVLSKSEEQMKERIKVLNQMIAAKGKKEETPQSIKDALAETKTKKASRYIR